MLKPNLMTLHGTKLGQELHPMGHQGNLQGPIHTIGRC
jgi:hypothetical protein